VLNYISQGRNHEKTGNGLYIDEDAGFSEKRLRPEYHCGQAVPGGD
jgi:hypothetical protein